MTDLDVVLARVLDDLDGDEVQRTAVGRAEVVVEGHPVEVQVATRGRLLLRITEATFVLAGPDCDEILEVVVRHTGMVRRTGLDAKVVEGGTVAGRLAAAVADSRRLERAAQPLDFTRFVVVGDGRRLRAHLTLMGASMTRMRLPPTTNYVRLHEDQRAALLAVADALDDAWALES